MIKKRSIQLIRRFTAILGDTRDLKRQELAAIITQKMVNAGLLYDRHCLKVQKPAIAAIACFFFTYGLQVVGLIDAKNDMDRLIECFSVMSFCGMGILKLVSLCRNHMRWKNILKNMTELERVQINNVKTDEEYESDDENPAISFDSSIHSYTKKFQTISNVLSKIYGFTLVVYVLSPFAEYGVFKYTGDDGLSCPHILPGWAPFDSVSFYAYLMNIALEFVAAVYCVCVHIAFDLTSIGIMIFVCGQFSLIRDYSENIGGRGAMCTLSRRRDERAHSRIVRCHKIHVLLITTCDELRELLQNILGVYFSFATLTLCSVAVRLNSELSSMELVSLLQYMCATLTQLYMFCYFGDNVQQQSAVDMGQGPFGAADWCLSPRIRRELTILGMAMIVPRRLKAGPFISVDLPSFIQVIRTAYSYFAVIRK